MGDLQSQGQIFRSEQNRRTLVSTLLFSCAGGLAEERAGRVLHLEQPNMLWRSSGFSVRRSVRSAMAIVIKEQFRSAAFPLIGAGSDDGSAERIQDFITDELSGMEFFAEVYIVRYLRKR